MPKWHFGSEALALMVKDDIQMPVEEEAEEQVLSAIFLDERAVDEVGPIVDSTDFYDELRGGIYRITQRLRADRKPVEPASILHEIKVSPRLHKLLSEASAGGENYLVTLGHRSATAAHAAHYAGLVRKASQKRKLYSILRAGSQASLNGSDPDEILKILDGDIDDLRRETRTAPKLTRVSDIVSVQIEWAWRGWLPRGMLAMIDGDPEIGKSQITCAITACWTTKKPFPFSAPDETRLPGNVLMIAPEDNDDSVKRPRLEAAGADLNRVFFWPGDIEPLTLPDGIDRLRPALLENDITLLIIDPIGAHFGPDINANCDADVRRALRPLVALAQELGITVLVVRHLNKDSGKSALYRGGGSIGFVAAARLVWAVGLDPNDRKRHVLAVLKSNIGPKPPSLFYRIDSWETTSRIVWEGESTYTASDIIVTNHRNPKKRSEAESIIAELLFSGPKPERDVWAACEAKSISHWSYKNARKQLGVVSSKRGLNQGWLLSLPEEDGLPQEVGQPEEDGQWS